MRQHDQRFRIVKQLLVWQFLGSIAVGIVGSFWSVSAAMGAFAGGITVLLPNCYFVFRAFRYRGARDAKRIVRSFYSGEAGKLILTAVLFVLVFVSLKPLNAPAVFIGYFCVQMLNWIVPLLASRAKA